MRSAALPVLALVLLCGCVSTAQMSKHTESADFLLDRDAFRSEGIGFLTPVAATGQEANRLSLALAFAESLTAAEPTLNVVSLPQVLSAVNQAEMAHDYRAMLVDYEGTGIMEKGTLRRVGEISGARYLGLLELADFGQSANKRFGIGGLRLLDTKLASIRVSWQIWDSAAGAIAWEGSEEIHYAYDTGRERPVTFAFVAEKAAASLISQILHGGPQADAPPAVAVVR